MREINSGINRSSEDVRIVCWSHDERRVLVATGGKQVWMNVEFDVPGDTMSRGYITIKGKRICVFA